ncbi:histidine phosphatase family protein [Demequina activiva]|uniref:Phosphoglycerate mutase n=1 Tax=Demequina activiva TaxID=1582364 RepID=A0A919UKL1_9MICO|nr:histidine phosphatase family protein [Demequina activiva]GIG55090.1 phosphoglycerate mutase [Demequina activiva]
MILWRHARTAYNADGRLQGSLDIPLGDEGHRQAARAAHRLVREHGTDLTIVSSPLSRAVDTADALAALTNGEVEVDQRLTQRPYGAWEGLTWADVQARWPEQLERRQRGEDPDIPGWGASPEVAARVGQALQDHWDPQRVTVVVSHGSTLSLGLRDVLGLDPLSRVLGSLPHAAWHEITRVDSGAWHIDAFGSGAD